MVPVGMLVLETTQAFVAAGCQDLLLKPLATTVEPLNNEARSDRLAFYTYARSLRAHFRLA